MNIQTCLFLLACDVHNAKCMRSHAVLSRFSGNIMRRLRHLVPTMTMLVTGNDGFGGAEP